MKGVTSQDLKAYESLQSATEVAVDVDRRSGNNSRRRATVSTSLHIDSPRVESSVASPVIAFAPSSTAMDLSHGASSCLQHSLSVEESVPGVSVDREDLRLQESRLGPQKYSLTHPTEETNQKSSVNAQPEHSAISREASSNAKATEEPPFSITPTVAILSASPENDVMLFGERRAASEARRRRALATSSALTDYEADLTSKDRLKQKEAIKRLLTNKVREDWEWTWPRPQDDQQAPTPIVNRSLEDLSEGDWTERDEWESNVSDTDDDSGYAEASKHEPAKPITDADPFYSDSADAVPDALPMLSEDRKFRRRRKLQDEMGWNDGVRCFTHRRNAWTGARHVRRVHIPLRRQTGSSYSDPQDSDVEGDPSLIVEIPIAPPILPPETPMRKGINEKAYGTIYDKVIVQSQTPFCPINLSVVVRSAVEGWKKDGEWPPKAGDMELLAKKAVGRTGLGWIEKESGIREKGVIKRSLQRVFGVGRREPDAAKGNGLSALRRGSKG